MTNPRPRDVAELDAGNARGLTGVQPIDSGELQVIRLRPQQESGDLDAAASVLGVDVADLVALRRKMGIAARHRRPAWWTRLFRKDSR